MRRMPCTQHGRLRLARVTSLSLLCHPRHGGAAGRGAAPAYQDVADTFLLQSLEERLNLLSKKEGVKGYLLIASGADPPPSGAHIVCN